MLDKILPAVEMTPKIEQPLGLETATQQWGDYR